MGWFEWQSRQTGFTTKIVWRTKSCPTNFNYWQIRVKRGFRGLIDRTLLESYATSFAILFPKWSNQFFKQKDKSGRCLSLIIIKVGNCSAMHPRLYYLFHQLIGMITTTLLFAPYLHVKYIHPYTSLVFICLVQKGNRRAVSHTFVIWQAKDA